MFQASGILSSDAVIARTSTFLFWILLSPLALADQATPTQTLCAPLLKDTQSAVESFLRRPETTVPDAIRRIVQFLAADQESTGAVKVDVWNKMVHIFNVSRTNDMIIFSCGKTMEQDFACWGGTRGHLLVFERSGKVFKSYNPARPNPHRGPGGYVSIDWNDETLKLLP